MLPRSANLDASKEKFLAEVNIKVTNKCKKKNNFWSKKTYP